MKPTTSKKKGCRKIKTSSAAAIDPRIHPDAAGVDVGAEEFVAALPVGRSDKPVRTFRSYTSGVRDLCDWFVAHGIKTVAMEPERSAGRQPKAAPQG
jgi:hypothetical protein